MSAVEIIELIKKLPPEERAAVAAFLNGNGADGSDPRVEEAATERKVRYIPNEEFEKVLPQIFEKHEELFRRLAQ